MLFTIYIILIAVNLLLAIAKYNIRIIKLLDYIFIWILIAGYSSGVDIDNYKYDYLMNSAQNTMFTINKGYVAIVEVCKHFDLDFFQFKMVVSAAALLLLWCGLNRLKANTHFVLFCYISYQLIFDTIQYRNFLGIAIFIFALPFLKENTKKGKIIYTILIMISASFHIVMLSYLLYVLIGSKLYEKYFKKLLIGFSVFIIAFTILNGTKVPFMKVIVKALNLSSYLEGYIQGASDSVAYLLPIISLVMCVLFLWYFKNERKNCNSGKFVYEIDKISLLFLPVCIMSFQWYRVIRNINLLNYVVFNEMQKNAHIGTNFRKIVYILIFLLLIWWIYCDIGRFLTLKNYWTLFTNNIFFQ